MASVNVFDCEIGWWERGIASLYCTMRIIFYYVTVVFFLFYYSKYKFFFNHFYYFRGGWVRGRVCTCKMWGIYVSV